MPTSIDDSVAKKEWRWKLDFDIKTMINKISKMLKIVVGNYILIHPPSPYSWKEKKVY